MLSCHCVCRVFLFPDPLLLQAVPVLDFCSAPFDLLLVSCLHEAEALRVRAGKLTAWGEMRALEETRLFPAGRAWWLWLTPCKQGERGSGVVAVLGDSTGGLFTLGLGLFLSPDSQYRKIS